MLGWLAFAWESEEEEETEPVIRPVGFVVPRQPVPRAPRDADEDILLFIL